MTKRKAPEDKLKTGRPSDFDPGYCAMLIEHMREGLSFESFGGVIGKCKQTLYNWEKEFPEFLDARKQGDVLGLLYWEKVGRDGLHNETIKDGDGTTVTRSINPTIWIFNMKNRHKWRDKQPDEEGDKTPTSNIPTADLLAIIRGNK